MTPDEFDTYREMEEQAEALRNGTGPVESNRALDEKPVYRPGGCVALLAALSLAAWVAVAVGLYLLVLRFGWVAAPLIVGGWITSLVAGAQR